MTPLISKDHKDYLEPTDRPHWTNRKGAPITLSTAAGGVGVVSGLVLGWLTTINEAPAAVIGGLIGWQVEKNRVKDDIANIRPIGTITAVNDDSFTIDLGADHGSREFTLTEATAIETAEGGTPADLTEGATVLVRGRNSEGDTQAVEVIVLPRDRQLPEIPDATSSDG